MTKTMATEERTAVGAGAAVSPRTGRFLPTAVALVAFATMGGVSPAQEETAPDPRPRSVRRLFVVRHDPSLIRLSGTMVEALLPGLTRYESGDGAAGVAAVRARVVMESVEQPPGVFAGWLVVECQAPAEEDAVRIADDLLEGLRGELERRLVTEPRARMERDLDALDREMAALFGTIEGSTERAVVEQRSRELAARTRELEVARAAENEVVQRLAAELEASERDGVEQRAQALSVQLELETMRAQLAGMTRQHPAFAEATQRVKALIAESDARTDAATDARQRAERLARSLDEARLGLQRTEGEFRAVSSELRAVRVQLADGDTASGRDGRLAEVRLESLRTQRAGLAARLASLRPVRLEVWR